jgi:hypothetical protein
VLTRSGCRNSGFGTSPDVTVWYFPDRHPIGVVEALVAISMSPAVAITVV